MNAKQTPEIKLFELKASLRGLGYDEEKVTFIVEALSSHDALILGLKQALKYLEHPDVEAIPFATRASVLAKQIRNVIAESGKGE